MKIPVKEIDLNEIIVDLNDLNQRCNHLKLKSTYADNDTRTMIFTLLSIEIQFLLLSISLSKNLKDVNFYKEQGYNIDDIDETFLSNSIYQYVGSLSNSYFILIFVQLENYLRLIASFKGIDNFKISTTIANLNKAFGVGEENLQLLKIILNLRNSMHNGGFYNHDSETINYKNHNFIFEKGQPILLGGIPFFIFLSFEIINNLIENTKEELLIEHNYANLNFEIEE